MTNQDQWQPSDIVTHKTVGDVQLHLHIFEPAERSADPAPAIVFFFGGGWAGGNIHQFYPHCAHLADKGMLATAAEYRVRSLHGTSPAECVKDGKSAVRWLRAHAAELNVDPDRIAAGGGSAGGHVAACTALVPGFEEEGEETFVSSCPDALVLFNPVANVLSLEQHVARFGADAEALSPAHHVRSNLPPAIIFHGTDDQTVPFESVKGFEEAMLAADNACKLIPYEGKGHGFFNYGRDDGAAYESTVKEMDVFLSGIGWIV